MTLDDILRQIFGNGGGAPAIGGDPVQASMAGEPPMYDPVARRYASEAPQMASPAPRLPAGGQTMAPGSMPPVQPGGASPPPAARPAANADPLSGLMPERPATDWRHTLGDVGLALQGRAVPDRAAMAAKAEQERQRANMTYQWMLKEGMSPEEARAALVSPEAQKVLFARRFGSGEKPTDEMREYDMARKQGFAGGFMDYKTKLKEAGASRVSIDQKQETEYDKKLGGLLAEDYVTAQRGASTAQRDLANLDTMKQALADPNLYTGSGGEAIQAAKKAAQTLLGMEVKGVSSAEVMQNIAKEIAVGNKQKLPGPMSDADRQFLVDMAPNLAKTPEGNRLIIELGMAGKRWEIARAQAAREYAARNGGRLDAGFYADLGKLDTQTGGEFQGIMARLRGMGEVAPRAPTAGLPDPLGLRK
jgi:hypothetical protein